MISLATTVKRGLINTTGDERQMNRSGCTEKNTRYWPVLLDHYRQANGWHSRYKVLSNGPHPDSLTRSYPG